jgi:hypothetical protein
MQLYNEIEKKNLEEEERVQDKNCPPLLKTIAPLSEVVNPEVRHSYVQDKGNW